MPEIEDAHPDRLDSHKILRFFWPLALSWIFMSVEGPACVGFISRMSDPVLHTAAFNLLMALALFIESPVIDLLSTSTTLANGRQSYLQLRRFVIGLMGLQTVIHAAFVLTPVYDLVAIDLMRIPADVAGAARLGLIWMIPWSACIGWRRFHQGILIRFGKTRVVGAGTFVRMATLITVSLTLFLSNAAPGATVAGISLISSVFAEAIFAYWGARSVIASNLGNDPKGVEPLTLSKLCRFHFPLTATTMVMFLGGPLVSSALAQAADPKLSMAAWQVASSVLWITRAAVYALPEVVITLGRAGALAAQTLRRFCSTVGVICSGIVVVAGLSGLDGLIFSRLLHADPATVHLASKAFLIGAPLPFIAAFQSYLRGMLTLNHLTASRLYAIVVGLSVLFAALQFGVAQKISGVEMVGYAMAIAMVAELAVLYAFWTKRRVA